MLFAYVGIGVAVLFGGLAVWAFAKHKRVVGVILIVLAILASLARLHVVDVATVEVPYNIITGNVRGLAPGTHIVWLWERIDKDAVYETRKLNYTMSSEVEEGPVKRVDAIEIISKGGLPSPWDVTLFFRAGPDPKEVALLHREIGPDYINKIVRPDIREGIRNIAGKYELLDANTKRDEVAKEIENLVRPRFKKMYVNLVRVLLRKIDLPEEYKKAIAEKKQKEQEAEAMIYVLQKEEKEKERKKIEAEGIAAYIQTIQQELAKDPEGLYKRWLTIEKLGDKVRVIISPAGTQPILPINEMMRDEEKEKSSDQKVIEFPTDEKENEKEKSEEESK